jgi:hypothetical protein
MDIEYLGNFADKHLEVKAIRKDISTAHTIIKNALQQYKKKMLKAKNKKQTEDLSMFAELADYKNKQDIQEAYGYDNISHAEMHQLNDLWDIREQIIANNGKFTDRVTQMLEWAMYNCGDMFADILEEHDEVLRKDAILREQIGKENRKIKI